MSSEPIRLWARALSAAFAERRIYIRTENKTRYVSVRPVAQIGGIVAAAAFLSWTGYTTSEFVTNTLDGRNARIQIDTMAEAYEAKLTAYGAQYRSLEEQLAQANQRRDVVTERLSDKQMRLVETANNLREATTELTVLRREFETMVDERRDEANRFGQLESRLTSTLTALTEAETSKADLDGSLETLSSAMDRVITERDSAAKKSMQLDGEVTRLAGTIENLNDRQERLLTRIEEAARTSFAGLETLFDRSNIDLDRILAAARRDYSGAGGPFTPLDEDSSAYDDLADDTRVASLMTDLETVNLMRFAADRLPFDDPAPGGRLTSGFGPRHDPKGRGRGLHTGLDIAAPRGTPVYATADGVVTFAGRQRGYGIVVKIRHAFGFETFYAHNSRARVKVGQRVSRGDRIADIGSTGRSTGNHVHYEIRLDNKPVNPSKFIEAARDVL